MTAQTAAQSVKNLLLRFFSSHHHHHQEIYIAVSQFFFVHKRKKIICTQDNNKRRYRVVYERESEKNIIILQRKIINIRRYTSVTSECVRKKSKVVFYAKSLFSSELSFSTTHSFLVKITHSKIPSFLSFLTRLLCGKFKRESGKQQQQQCKEKRRIFFSISHSSSGVYVHVLLNLLLSTL